MKLKLNENILSRLIISSIGFLELNEDNKVSGDCTGNLSKSNNKLM